MDINDLISTIDYFLKLHMGTKIGKYTAYVNGIAVDNETGMMWTRCSIGQEWDSEQLTCTGKAKKYTWEGAVKAVEKLNQEYYLGYNDWKLPQIEDLETLLYCTTGFDDAKIVIIPTKTGIKKEFARGCNGNNFQTPAINRQVFPNSKKLYWSSSPYTNGNYDNVWLMNFGNENINNKYVDYVDIAFVRARRSRSQ